MKNKLPSHSGLCIPSPEATTVVSRLPSEICYIDTRISEESTLLRPLNVGIHKYTCSFYGCIVSHCINSS